MSILSATNLTQSFDFVDVFTGINLSVTHDAKVGLIGPNGVGKTSLLRILCGMEQPVSGTVSLAKGKRLGYLPQEAYDAFSDSSNSVWDEMLHVFDDLHAMEARMRELEVEMARPSTARIGIRSAQGAHLEEYGDLQHEFEHRGGYDTETRIKQTLAGLGFDKTNWDVPVAHLSGGQKTRALLAKLLLQNPDLLILDEPTNHLDVEAIEWLEKSMVAWEGALIVCSHDRYFLDKVVNRIWEMSRTNIEVYRGNYSAYLQQREERFERSIFVFNQEKARLQNDARLIKRDFDAVKGGNDMDLSWAKGKLKRLTRDVVTIEKFGTEVLLNEKWNEIAERMAMDGGKPVPFGMEEAVKRVDRLRPPSKPPKLNLKLQPSKRSGAIVLRTQGLVVGYTRQGEEVTGGQDDKVNQASPLHPVTLSPSHPLFTCDDVELRWKERAALIGPNGSGKTTFLKTALSSRTLHDDPLDVGLHPVPGLAPLSGSVEVGSSLRVGYFAQAHDELDANSTIQAEVERHAEAAKKPMQVGDLRYFLAQFLFKDDDLFKPINGLSGGERARLALAILSLQGANFLVLDEPTNHLDIATQEVLEEVLSQFDGTILMVSHDRYLIDKLAEQVWWIEDGRLSAFKGNYKEFSAEREKPKGSAAKKQPQRQKDEREKNPSPGPSPKKGGEKNAPQVHKLQTQTQTQTQTPTQTQTAPSKNQDKRRAEKLSQIESQISDLEAHLGAINKDMENAGAQNQNGKVRELSEDYASTQRALDALMKEWEKLTA